MTKIFAAAIVLGLLAVPAMAQSAVTAQIPFAFYVGDKMLPAGPYIFESLTAHTMRITNTNTRDGATVLTPIPIGEREPVRSNKIVFRRYGNDSFFTEMWWAGYSSGRSTWKTDLEATLARRVPSIRIESVSAR